MDQPTPYRWQLSDLPFELEKVLGADPASFVDPQEYRIAMIRAERCIARIENPEGLPLGTGFLISPDLLITNDHVRLDSPEHKRSFDSNPAAVRIRFGYVEQGRVSSRVCELDSGAWMVARSSETDLDYCVVRLSERVGEHRIGPRDDAPVRGWITPKSSNGSVNQSLSILQHPQGEPMKLAQGNLGTATKAWIDYHVNTDRGSSGSPVFDCQWNCIALHSRAGKTRNSGVSFRAILESLGDAVRDELVSFQPPADNSDLEGLPASGPGTVTDFTVLPLSGLQDVAATLLKATTAARLGGQPQEFETKLGNGKRLRCTPGASAFDDMQRLALKGDLDLLQVAHRAYQYHQTNYQLDPVAPIVWPHFIQRDIDTMGQAADSIRQRLDVMIDRCWLTRDA